MRSAKGGGADVILSGAKDLPRERIIVVCPC